jgi:hypothetical protein
MDPIDYVMLPELPTPVCIICGQRSPFMFFPCGCTHPIHGKCLPIWRQHKGRVLDVMPYGLMSFKSLRKHQCPLVTSTIISVY